MRAGLVRMEPLTMSKNERKKLDVMHRLERGELSRSAAAQLLQISERQVYRLYRRYRQLGDRGVVHRARGGHSARLTGLALRNQVLLLYRQSYRDYGPTLLSEVLASDHGIQISRETVRRWAIDAGLWQRPVHGRRSRTHRKARPRRSHVGAMIQFDGSTHDWFEGRSPELRQLTLLVIVDDASGHVMLRFANEQTIDVFQLLYDYSRSYGLPQAIYTDHASVYGIAASDKTQYRRALEELGIERIQAHSPQAKGRVERCNKTLQDRLVKALRKANIATVEAANRFLEQTFTPAFNLRFAPHFPQMLQDRNAHRLVDPALLDRCFAIEVLRKIRNDYTIVVGTARYQIDKPKLPQDYPLPVPGTSVSVRIHLNGSLAAYLGDPLTAKPIPLRPVDPGDPNFSLKIPGRNRTTSQPMHLHLKHTERTRQHYAQRNP